MKPTQAKIRQVTLTGFICKQLHFGRHDLVDLLSDSRKICRKLELNLIFRIIMSRSNGVALDGHCFILPMISRWQKECGCSS